MPASRFDRALATLAALRQAGVDVIAGTDAAALAVRGVTDEARLRAELQLFVQAGFSPAEALRQSTVVSAQVLKEHAVARPGGTHVAAGGTGDQPDLAGFAAGGSSTRSWNRDSADSRPPAGSDR